MIHPQPTTTLMLLSNTEPPPRSTRPGVLPVLLTRLRELRERGASPIAEAAAG